MVQRDVLVKQADIIKSALFYTKSTVKHQFSLYSLQKYDSIIIRLLVQFLGKQR